MTSISIEVDDEMFEALQEVAQDASISIEEAVVEVLQDGLFECEDAGEEEEEVEQ